MTTESTVNKKSPDLTNKNLDKKSSFSRDLELKNLDIQIDEQRFEQEFIYRSCCLEVDKRALDFFCKMLIILSVLIFCLVALAIGSDHSEIYFSMVSSIVSLFVRPPSLYRAGGEDEKREK